VSQGVAPREEHKSQKSFRSPTNPKQGNMKYFARIRAPEVSTLGRTRLEEKREPNTHPLRTLNKSRQKREGFPRQVIIQKQRKREIRQTEGGSRSLVAETRLTRGLAGTVGEGEALGTTCQWGGGVYVKHIEKKLQRTNRSGRSALRACKTHCRPHNRGN